MEYLEILRKNDIQFNDDYLFEFFDDVRDWEWVFRFAYNVSVRCTFCFFVVSLLLQIFRCAAPFALLYCSCSYKYFAALPLVLRCDVFAATNVLRRCRWFPVVMLLRLKLFRSSAAGSLLWCSCGYKYFAALPLVPCCDALAVTNISQLCCWVPVVLLLVL